MSVKIGGRIVQPAFPVVDSSLPGPVELAFQKSLDDFCKDNIPLESTVGIQTRERVLNQMGAICREWIKSVCLKKGLPKDVVESAGGNLFTSGSYRLGVHEPGADIDTILVVPSMCTQQDFFGEVIQENADGSQVRDPNSLAERIRRHPDVTNFVPVETAAVPILTFDWQSINIDLLFARLNSTSVPGDFDIDNDAVLDGVDTATEKSLNGPRVTNLIAALVSETPERYQTFLTVVRCVRKWAKMRGLYSNKFGYWGGVNINMAVALCVQLYPMACPASLLRKFFLVFKTWRWPNPIMLTKPHDAGYGLTVWNANSVQNARQVAPMITPAYPAMNSTLSASRQTLQIMHEEFCRGHDIMSKLWKKHEQHYNSHNEPPADLNWKELFEPSNFFIAYPQYLSVCIAGPTQADSQAWAGFVESRLRKFASDMLGRSLPLSKIQLWPKKMEACVADRGALLTQAQRRNSLTYFIGFQVDKLRMRGDQLNIEQQLQNFREWELSRFSSLVSGMDVCAKTFRVKELPKQCFEGIYEGGKAEAMKIRRKLLNADPKRQEKKRLARLQELKAKMAEIQRQKEEKRKQEEEKVKAAEEDEDSSKKRKRSDADEDEAYIEEATDMVKKVKMEMEDVALADDGQQGGDDENEGGLAKQEEDLLESALDNIQDTADGERKTREEAEAEKQKLLGGELLEEGPYEEGDEEEYTGDYRSTIVPLAKKEHKPSKNKYCLPITDEDAEMLKKIGISIVSDDETQIVGGNLIPPWTRPLPPNDPATKEKPKAKGPTLTRKSRIKFVEKFDIVELDANGHVIDKGDEDFTPSTKWNGRKAGFEFKLGARGLGYYRTGRKVVVPANTAY